MKTTNSQTSQLIGSSQIERYTFLCRFYLSFIWNSFEYVYADVTIKPLIGGGKKLTKMAFLHVNKNLFAMSTNFVVQYTPKRTHSRNHTIR